jgi:hypothetical protein
MRRCGAELRTKSWPSSFAVWCRRKKSGTILASRILCRHPGRWCILGDNALNLIRMDSWRALLPHSLKEPGEITSAFARAGVYDYRAAARYVSHLAYGRNNESSNAMVVLSEQRGTCSTKHALLRRLAFEQQLPVKLMLGIFEMSGKNTPRVGAVLENTDCSPCPKLIAIFGPMATA